MFDQALNYLGGLLGFNSNPQMPPAGPEYYGEAAAAGAATNPPPVPRPDPFARFSPDQRQALGYASLIDAFGAAAGSPTGAASGLMQTFDLTSGRSQRGGLPQIAQQQAPQAPQPMQIQAPQMRPMPQIQAPQIQIGMPPRRGVTNPLFLGG
jgi:hypothetical protein